MFLALLDLICIICHDWVIFKWLCQLNSKVDSFNINSYCLFKPKNKIFLILDLICWFTMLREWFASGCVCWISTIGPSSSLRNQTGLLQRKTIKDEGLKKVSSTKQAMIHQTGSILNNILTSVCLGRGTWLPRLLQEHHV